MIPELFNPHQQVKLWNRFRRIRKGTPKEVRVPFGQLQNLRRQRQLLAAALFGPSGRWVELLSSIEDREAALQEKKKRARNPQWYYWGQLEEKFGPKQAHRFHEKGELVTWTPKDALSGEDVYQYRLMTAS